MQENSIIKRYELMKPYMNERTRRIILGAEAMALGWGGITKVSKATGVHRETITIGCNEIKNAKLLDIKRIRKKGGGRKKTIDKDPTVITDLENLIEPVTRGDPESPLRWTSKSLRNLTKELNKMGHEVSHSRVEDILHDLEYSLQANKKTIEGKAHPDRDAQFEYINQKSKEFLQQEQPVISVDTKKKELVGNFKNGGRELRPKGEPELVNSHDFLIPELGKANPFGVYDDEKNTGWVNVGTDSDTAEFAVESIRRWWLFMGKKSYPNAKDLLICADSGGSNGYRIKLWKVELQELADETGLTISVCHFPPGTSKWNKIEHRLFSFISQNWRGKPLISHEVIVNLIASTTTEKGLRVECSLDTNSYQKGIKVSNEELLNLNIIRSEFHGEWNYSIIPRNV
ncbi:MAG: ISAzo13 family transposase [Candidatus Methanoperedens sp.]|nr:ISAzo13 family transposase [Candidatus Methanoperedens sp.]